MVHYKQKFLSDVLGRMEERAVRRMLAGFTERERIYHAWPLFRTFLAQVVCGGSCRKAIERGISQGWLPRSASPLTAAYCNARQRMPEDPLRELALDLGRRLAKATSSRRRFMGRCVKVVDGTSVQMPDTPDNQAEYPQPSAQAEGCGLPVMYLAALMDLDTGALVDVEEWGQGHGHERNGFRAMWRSLKPGDIVLGDGGLVSYADMALLVRRGIDSVFEAGTRKFSPGTDDEIVTLNRPYVLGDWVKRKHLPETLTVRVIHFRVTVPGSRKKAVTLMTTLLDRGAYPKRKLMRLYRRRWEMELRFRDIKTTMGLELLTAKTAEGGRKEIWMALVACNLIRTVMVAAARRMDKPVGRISFAGTVDRLEAFGMCPLQVQDPAGLFALLLDHLCDDLLPHRPNRVEPRKRKRRPKNYRLLNRPREVERQELLRA
jgi:hypothetical protein